MIAVSVDGSFAGWRHHARRLICEKRPPSEVLWTDERGGGNLFCESARPSVPAGEDVVTDAGLRLPRVFLDRAERVAHHASEERWGLLYRLVWRIAVERDRGLLDDASDSDVRTFDLMEREVRFDAHRAKAFVRFRRLGSADSERFVAWHRPRHHILPLVAPFFARRFGVMRWTIFTPRASADWDGASLTMGAGVPEAPGADEESIERLWLTYYGSIFNPARIKVDAMLKEMPVRYWSTMPETRLVQEMLRDAPARVHRMLAATRGREPGAEAFVPPPNHRSLPQLRNAAAGCEGCDLCRVGSRTVFGEGPARTRVMVVGEQPGDEEDLAGRPFVGPAGRLLDHAFQEAGIERGEVYLTNAVKHFRHEPRGKRRIHMRPTATQVRACAPWLSLEIEAIAPRVIVALGVTAGKVLIDPAFTVARHRGISRFHERWNATVIGTMHPSGVLRTPEGIGRDRAFRDLVEDLRLASQAAGALPVE